MRGPRVLKRRWKRNGKIVESPWWYLCYYTGSRRVLRRTSPPTTNKTLAKEQLVGRLSSTATSASGSIASVVTAYSDYLGSTSASTFATRKPAIAWWKDRFGQRQAASITRQDVDAAARDLLKSGKSPGYVRVFLSVLKAAARRASPAVIPLASDLRSFPILLTSPRRRTTWSDEELGRVCGRLPPWASAAVRLMRYTGLRVGDCLALKWESVKDGSLSFHSEKPGAEVVLPLIGAARGVLDEIPRVSEWVFPSETLKSHKSLRNFYRLWHPALTEEKLRHKHVHDIRRSFAQDMHRAGYSRHFIADLLGQRTTTVVEHYTSAEVDVMRTALEKAMAFVSVRVALRVAVTERDGA